METHGTSERIRTKPLTIGQIARLSGVGIETIRFYERQGLVPEPRRKPSGYRQYGDDVVERLAFIRRAKELGFTLSEIRSLLALRADPDSSAADVKHRARQKIAEIDDKIRSLQEIRSALAKITTACRGRGPLSDCPILDALEGRPLSPPPVTEPNHDQD